MSGGKPNKSSYSAVAVIESAHFRNFKSLRDVELTGLQRLTVLVGPSGVGKTSVLQGLNLLTHALQTMSDRNPMMGHLSLKRWATRGEDELQIRLSAGDQELTVTNAGEFVVHVEQGELIYKLRVEKHKHGRARLVGWSEDDDIDTGFYRHVLDSTLFKFDPEQLGRPSRAARSPQIAANGAGLATFLAYLAGADREALEAIERELQEVVEITGRIRTLPDEITIEERENIRIDEQFVPRVTHRKVAAHRFEVEVDQFGSVSGDLLSEGTLVTLGLLAVLHQPGCPSLVLFDDIDQGLHPDAQAKLIAALRKLLAKREDLQIICTTHSPYLLDHVAPEEVQVMSFDEGQVVAARLDQHEDWPNWKGKLQTGEFWQSAGEDWVKASKRDGE